MKVTIFTTISHVKCRKTINFLKSYGIPYSERKVTNDSPLRTEELQKIVSVCGLNEILATKSKPYPRLEQMLNSEWATLNDVFHFIQRNPSVLRFPILFDNKRTCIGYNEEDLRAFLPRDIKIRSYMQVLHEVEEGELSLV